RGVPRRPPGPRGPRQLRQPRRKEPLLTDCPRGRARLARPVAVIALGLAVSACGSGLPGPAPSSPPLTPPPSAPAPPPRPVPAAQTPSPSPPAKPLAGKVIGIDPGHNGGNFADPGAINKQVWNGREWESCDTTGTDTVSGYTEALFNFNVARYL